MEAKLKFFPLFSVFAPIFLCLFIMCKFLNNWCFIYLLYLNLQKNSWFCTKIYICRTDGWIHKSFQVIFFSVYTCKFFALLILCKLLINLFIFNKKVHVNVCVTYLCMFFRQAMWPNGAPAFPGADREYKIRMRTRVAAKLLMLCSIPGKY